VARDDVIGKFPKIFVASRARQEGGSCIPSAVRAYSALVTPAPLADLLSGHDRPPACYVQCVMPGALLRRFKDFKEVPMLAKIKAKLVAAKAYVVVHWKQLVAAVAAGHWGSSILAAALALVHKL
jgi:hypothetical protein